MKSPFSWRLLVLGTLLCVLAAAATPYVVLKLGMSVDLSFAGMFLGSVFLAKVASNRKDLAVQLNILQTMINAVSGVGFMCVILAAFHYIQGVFDRDIGFDPTWWQIAIWVFVSANLGVFMGALPRRMLLNDPSLPWPSGQAVLSVAQTLSDPAADETTRSRRHALTASTGVAGFLTFLRDGFGLLPEIVANPALAMSLGLQFAGIGFGMFVPLTVGLSGLIGVWGINTFGERVAKLSALSGTAPEHFAVCRELMAKGEVTDFLTQNCGNATQYLGAGSHFKYVVQWFMWPATAMMIAAALTSILVPLIRNWMTRKDNQSQAVQTQADERVPMSWIWIGIAVFTVLLIWLQSAWFAMPPEQVLFAIALQPILIIAGARVLGITGQGPVSLMANATQFLFGLLWPAHIQQNLNAAHVSADPQASSESTIVAFWVARRVGGSFWTLMVAQLLVIGIGALILPIVFTLLVNTYGVGLEPGQLTAPTGLKIASLAMVMEKGVSALPSGALQASIVAIILGVGLELLLSLRTKDAEGHEGQRFAWLPVPSMVGFSFILPPTIMIAIAIGSVISSVWRSFSPGEQGSYGHYAAPLAAGLIAGEAMVGAILIPALVLLTQFL